MATYRSNGYRVELPETASSAESAAIIAALETHLADEEHGTDGRERDRWTFAGRLGSVLRRGGRHPASASALDPWTAAGRIDRF